MGEGKVSVMRCNRRWKRNASDNNSVSTRRKIIELFISYIFLEIYISFCPSASAQRPAFDTMPRPPLRGQPLILCHPWWQPTYRYLQSLPWAGEGAGYKPWTTDLQSCAPNIEPSLRCLTICSFNSAFFEHRSTARRKNHWNLRVAAQINPPNATRPLRKSIQQRVEWDSSTISGQWQL